MEWMGKFPLLKFSADVNHLIIISTHMHMDSIDG